MTTRINAPVAIVGAGPVGLTLALDLAARGIRSVIIEQRRPGEQPSVKCNHVASRTMETSGDWVLLTRFAALACPMITRTTSW
jgi:2-polyprenyl-6-methoxyphenol hydroxylase-like FAD-dependent oxidoreductase